MNNNTIRVTLEEVVAFAADTMNNNNSTIPSPIDLGLSTVDWQVCWPNTRTTVIDEDGDVVFTLPTRLWTLEQVREVAKVHLRAYLLGRKRGRVEFAQDLSKLLEEAH